MHVLITSSGIMKQYFPSEQIRIPLPDGASLGDLISAFGTLHGEMLPQSVWNHEKRIFRGPIILSSDGKVLTDRTEILNDGQVITIKRFLIGG